jgi:LPS O-antigen subunit length determinant protein (WzzB/FepE family)
MFNLSFQSLSPAFAQEVVQNLVPALNDHMRDRDLVEAQRSVSYLEEKIEETSITGMRQVFFQLIESETRKIMLANANPEYVFETIDPAVKPRSPSLPNRQLIAMVATLSGTLFGVLLVISLSFFRSSRPSQPAE